MTSAEELKKHRVLCRKRGGSQKEWHDYESEADRHFFLEFRALRRCSWRKMKRPGQVVL